MSTIYIVFLVVFASVAVFLAAYTTMKVFVKTEQERLHEEYRRNTSSLILPARLQAYERMVLFLERISPDSLVLRAHKGDMSAHQLHVEILKMIKTEYEHNLSQQIYISPSAWTLIKNAKEEILKAINIASTKISDNASGLELGRVIIEVSSQVNILPNQIALEYLKKEVGLLF
jgi:hypothetical protein